MSKVSKVTVNIPEGVEVKIERNRLVVRGPNGEISKPLPRGIDVRIENKIVLIDLEPGSDFKAGVGLVEALLNNMIEGVKELFTKVLELVGVGFRASVEGNKLKLLVGYSHPVEITSPDQIKLSVSENKIKVEGIDKELVGQIAYKIRAARPPEPYKGKGIKYVEELIKRKPGKTVKAAV